VRYRRESAATGGRWAGLEVREDGDQGCESGDDDYCASPVDVTLGE
jgi:hypothetical protein